ncbi:MAG: transglutaminase-like cysteine peptidase [Gammaproteobacteria bacterium]|nr:transglutaminase-like cysteine peptidase [Gammaproteobacteria bacterium]
MLRWISIFLLACLTGCGGSVPKVTSSSIPSDGIDPVTRERVAQWKSLVDAGTQWSDIQRLTSVNNFVNQLNFVDDSEHWKQEDYWATPLQTLVTRGGDCEDFAIAKYFTLSAMGMDEQKLRLTYVKALTINKAHMVVSYFEQPRSEPIVLDNLNPQILPASQRKDLLPVYSFNGTGLWLAKREQSGQYIDDAGRLTLWQQLLRHMDVEAADENAMVCLYQHYDLPESEAKTLCP